MIKGFSEDKACDLEFEVIAENSASWKDRSQKGLFPARPRQMDKQEGESGKQISRQT